MYRLSAILILTIAVSALQETYARQNDAEPPQQERQEETEKVNPYFECVVSPDRTVMRRFDQAKRLIEAGRGAEAAQLLGAILETCADYFIPPPFSGEEADAVSERTSKRLFSDLVLETLAGLPAKARESYKLQYEAQARRLLEHAIAQGSFEGLQRVARNYFPTESGATATFLIGMDQFQHGDWEAALSTLVRLDSRAVEMRSFEPLYSLTLATCQLRAKREDEAKKTVERLWKHFPKPSLLLAGKEPWTPQTPEDILAKLNESITAADQPSIMDWLERTGWLLARGTASQNPETVAGRPLLDLLWSLPSLTQPLYASQVNLLQGLVQRAEETYIPALQPLLIRNHLIVRGLGETTAVDVQTGKRVWSVAEPEYRVPRAVGQSPYRIWPRQLSAIPQYQRFALRIFFWHDRITHQLSSDGTRLFTVEGLDLMPMSNWGVAGRRNIQIGTRSIEDPRLRTGSTLVALDAKTGRTLWRVGKFPYAQKVFDRLNEELEQSKAEARKKKKEKEQAPEPAKPVENRDRNDDANFSEEELFLSETWFLGAPLPLHGRLYLIGENSGIVRLIVLDAATGKLITQQPLLQSPVPFENDWLRRYYGLTPSAANGILFCPTGQGMVVAVDAGTAAPLWCFSYFTPPKDEPGNRNQFQNPRYFHYGTEGNNEEFRNLFSKTGWQIPCIMVDGPRLLIAPPDVPALYCLDSLTGERLWQRDDFKRENSLYVACIRNGTAYIVTPEGMTALSMQDGRQVWEMTMDEGKPGRRAKTASPPTPNMPVPIPMKETSEPEPEKSEAASRTAEPLPKLVFFQYAAGLRPTGTGIRHENNYFLPLSDGYLGIVDLDRADMKLVSSRTLSRKTEAAQQNDIPAEDEPSDMDVSAEDTVPRPNGPETRRWSPSSLLDALTTKSVPLGNLIGIQGRFYSQSPLQIGAFDQWDALNKQTDALLKADPDDPQGLLQLGKIRCAEGNVPEAVALFRRSMQIRPSADAADRLRKVLLDVVRDDYAAWKESGPELESLAEFPEELAEVLFALARGSLRGGDMDPLIATLLKSIRLELDHSVLVEVDSEWNAQLHRALGALIAEQAKRRADPEIDRRLRQLALELGQGFASGTPDQMLPGLQPSAGTSRFMLRPWWEQDLVLSSEETRRWRIYRELFRGLDATGQADKKLAEQYERNAQLLSLELLLNSPVAWPLPVSRTQPLPPTPDSPPVSRQDDPTTLPDLVVLNRIAARLESAGNVSDAYTYYRMFKDLYGEQGEKLHAEALNRPAVKEYYDRRIAAHGWPGQSVLFQEGETGPIVESPGRQNPHGDAVARILRNARSRTLLPTNRVSLPVLGSFEPLMSSYDYSLETVHQDIFLVCRDATGTECWRFELSTVVSDMAEYGYFSDNHLFARQGFFDLPVYLVGLDHLLLLVRGNLLLAFDTFDAGGGESPRLLWTRTSNGVLSARPLYGSVTLNYLASGSLMGKPFLRNPIVLTSDVVCYRDIDRIYGLDPLTGRTLWSRDVNSTSCSIHGNRDHLFLVFPDMCRAAALDPCSGRELAGGTIPRGAVYSFESDLVFLEPNKTQPGANKTNFQLFAVDLRDLFLSPRNPGVKQDGDAAPTDGSLPRYTIRDSLSGTTLIRPVFRDRLFATLSWETKTLQLYDLSTKRDWLGPMGDWGRRTGVQLPEVQGKNVRPDSADLDIELDGDHLLVLFVGDRNVDFSQKDMVEDGVRFKRSLTVVNNIACRGVAAGVLMRYDFDGNPCWDEPVRITNWFRVMNVSPLSPVVLFAATANDQEQRGVTHTSTGLLGIDKRTGKERFNPLIPPVSGRPHTLLQGFRVAVDPASDTISFVAPNRVLNVVFTDRPAPPKSQPEKKPEPSSSPLNLLKNWNFN